MDRWVKNTLGIGLLLCAAALSGFACWAVARLAPVGAQLLSQATQSVEIVGDTAASVKVAADRAGETIAEMQPKLQQTAANLEAATGNLQAASRDAAALVAEEKPLVEAATQNIVGASANLKDASAGLDAAVAELNAPCEPAPCGTLADVNRTLASFRLAAGQVTAFSEKEDAQRQLMNKQEAQLAAQSNEALTKLNAALGSLSSMADDTAKAWHAFLHPKWPKKLESAVEGVGTTALKVFW